MDKICYNNNIIDYNAFLISLDNRGFKYGDSFFETIKCVNGIPLFWDEHYFRIAGAFLIMKMIPPDNFTSEFFLSLIKNLLINNNLDNSIARVRISFFRNQGGYYLPLENNISFVIESNELSQQQHYTLNLDGLNVGFYKENTLSKNPINNIKSNNKLINILGSIYAKNNNFDDCILLNTDNQIVEFLSGNIFIISNKKLITPSLADGCLDGVMRKILLNNLHISAEESSITFSDLLNADEVFMTNVISGVQWVGKIKNKTYSNNYCQKLINKLNTKYLI
ncbi:MAG: aminotransferase class IV [Flavobacteriales bacterium]|nr:aminotransferase class IV [Flavobacteriales bacterium]|tara:strand:+ start:3242 stop:4081 length:840 start_codon:yes stop_codon:yes gene_type:complete